MPDDADAKDLNIGDPHAIALEQSTLILKDGVSLMRAGDHGAAIRKFEEVYKSESLPKPVSGLSYYAYCLARIRKQHRQAIELCERAVSERPDDPAHWANLAEVLLLANRRVRAINTAEEALTRFPRTKLLQDLRARIGTRRPPVLPFLSRSNPVNMILGHIRHTWNQKKESKQQGPARKTT
ncbi:MAG: tetratricopeptide repeat protein [Acidobacteria bacterium]|nr:tetratricopeptide repeat protein [Acidobacteriota bacterium]